jgi:hypothetical protein
MSYRKVISDQLLADAQEPKQAGEPK